MAVEDVTLKERDVSGGGSVGENGRRSLLYNATGSDSYDDVLGAIEGVGGAPATLSGLYRQRPDIRPITVGGVIRRWEVEVPYVPAGFSPKAYGFQYLRGRTTGATEHLKYSKGTRQIYPNPEGGSPFSTSADHRGAIGVRSEGGQVVIDGVDVPGRQMTFEIGWLFADADVDAAFLGTIYNLTGTTNDDTWWNYAAKEVTFLGADFNRNSLGDWEFVYYFKAEPNKIATAEGSTAVGSAWIANASGDGGYGPVGPIKGITKYGSDYVWAEYSTTEDATAKRLAATPVQVNVEIVCDPADFELLGIGTTFQY